GSDPACVPSLLSGTDSQSMPQTPSRDDNLPWTHALPLWGNVHSFPFCKSYTLLLSAKAPECPSWQTASAPSPADLPFCGADSPDSSPVLPKPCESQSHTPRHQCRQASGAKRF